MKTKKKKKTRNDSEMIQTTSVGSLCRITDMTLALTQRFSYTNTCDSQRDRLRRFISAK